MPVGVTRKGAGQRIHKCQLQSATVTKDALRGRTNVWTTYATTLAAVDVTPFVVTEQSATLLYLVTIPYDERVDVQQRALITLINGDELRLKVLAVVNPELRASRTDMVLHCAEATDDE